MPRAFLAGISTVALLVAAGCGPHARSNAHIAGTVRLCSVEACVPEAIRVSVLDTNGRVVVSRRSATGHFIVTVVPGSYEVSVQTSRYLVGTAWVGAVSERTATADFMDDRAG